MTMEAGMSPPSGRGFFKRHWKAFGLFIVAVVLLFIGAVYVFVWFAGMAETSLVPAVLGGWTMGNLVSFIVYLALWEILLIGIPAIILGVAGWQWWKRLPIEDRGSRMMRKGSKAGRGSGGVGFLFFIAFVIKVYLDGKWNVPISTYTLDYVVGSTVTILLWGLGIAVIVGGIAFAWWASRQMRN